MATGGSLLNYYRINSPSYLRSHYRDNVSFNVSSDNDLYLNKQSSTTVKDVAEGTVLSAKGWNYIGTDFSLNTFVPHYSLLWGQSHPLNQDVIDFRVYHYLHSDSSSYR